MKGSYTYVYEPLLSMIFTFYTYFMFVQGLADAEEIFEEMEDCSSIWTAAAIEVEAENEKLPGQCD